MGRCGWLASGLMAANDAEEAALIYWSIEGRLTGQSASGCAISRAVAGRLRAGGSRHPHGLSLKRSGAVAGAIHILGNDGGRLRSAGCVSLGDAGGSVAGDIQRCPLRARRRWHAAREFVVGKATGISGASASPALRTIGQCRPRSSFPSHRQLAPGGLSGHACNFDERGVLRWRVCNRRKMNHTLLLPSR